MLLKNRSNKLYNLFKRKIREIEQAQKLSHLEEGDLVKPCVVSACGFIAMEASGKWFEVGQCQILLSI